MKMRREGRVPDVASSADDTQIRLPRLHARNTLLIRRHPTMMAKIGEPHKRLPAPGGARRANTCRKNEQTDRYLCSSFCRRHAFPQTSAIGIGDGRPLQGSADPRHHRLPRPSLHSTATGRVASSSPDSLILHGRCDWARGQWIKASAVDCFALGGAAFPRLLRLLQVPAAQRYLFTDACARW
jgi:hypothetical protein